MASAPSAVPAFSTVSYPHVRGRGVDAAYGLWMSAQHEDSVTLCQAGCREREGQNKHSHTIINTHSIISSIT